MRRQAWLAIIVCIVGLVPGLVAGGIGAYLYRLTTAWHIGYNPDFWMLRTIFGIEWPGLIVQWIFFECFPELVHGLLAGLVAIFLTGIVCKGAPIEIAAYATGTLVTGLLVVAVIVGLVISGKIDLTIVDAVVQIVGLWSGLISGLSSFPRAQVSEV